MTALVQSKVPEITLIFWIIKILTTAMGEATSDYLVFHWNPVLAVLLCTAALCLAFVLQFRQRRYRAAIYWLLVVMVAIVGTMAADILHVVIGVPYLASTLGFATILGLVFLLWYRSEGTLSIHHITTRKREFYYWLAICATFALGTAAGDMTAATLGFGFFYSGLLFLALFLAPGLLYRAGALGSIPAFWISYIMTRPLGASFADWAGKPVSWGGKGLGSGHVALVLTAAILLLVGMASLRGAGRAAEDRRHLARAEGGDRL
ncbi:COG4705 family protein [Acidisoma sp. C75]